MPNMLYFPDYWLVRPVSSEPPCAPPLDTSGSDVEMAPPTQSSKLKVIGEDRQVNDFTLPGQVRATTLDDRSLEEGHVRRPSTPPNRVLATLAAGTPITGSLGSFEKNDDGSATDKAVLAYLSDLLKDKVVHDYPIADFIYDVYGISKDDLKHPEGGYQMPVDDCRNYSDGGFIKNSSHERSAYEPLMNIFSKLADQLKRNVKGHRLNGSDMINMLDCVVSGDFAKLKPDFLASWLKFKEDQTWKATAISGELKKKKTKTKTAFVSRVDLSQIPERIHTSPKASVDTDASTTTGTTTAADATDALDDPDDCDVVDAPGVEDDAAAEPDFENENEVESEPEPELESVASIISEGRKRKAGSALPRAPKRPRSNTTSTAQQQRWRPNKLFPAEMQAVKYVHELGSHGIRSFASGFLIQNFTMTLWYMDRMGLVSTTPFDFIDQPHFLLLYLAAIRYATPTKLGFFSKLRFPKDVVTVKRLNTFDGVTLDLSGAADAQSKPINDLRFLMDISTDRKIIPTYGAVGRATIVAPIKPDPDCEASVAICGEAKSVVKISWQSAWREASEDGLIRVARVKLGESESLREHLKNIVDLKCALSQTMQEMEIPRATMYGLKKKLGAERLCRIIVMTEYLPLKMVDDAAEFKTIFVGVVKGHHAVYQTSGILHRDISINNIMFYRDTKGAVGVLCDWDLAKELPTTDQQAQLDIAVEDTLAAAMYIKKVTPPPQPTQRPLSVNAAPLLNVEVVTPQEPRYRTGTGPFMAIDLLLFRKVPHHTYRHDLESFFFVFVWFVATHRPDNHTLGYIRKWLQGDLWSLGQSKKLFVDDPAIRDEVMSTVCKEYETDLLECVDLLLITVIKPLIRKYTDIQDEMAKTWQKLKANQKPAEEKLALAMNSKKIRNLVHEREFNIMTYESFMECLGEENPDLDEENLDG